MPMEQRASRKTPSARVRAAAHQLSSLRVCSTSASHYGNAAATRAIKKKTTASGRKSERWRQCTTPWAEGIMHTQVLAKTRASACTDSKQRASDIAGRAGQSTRPEDSRRVSRVMSATGEARRAVGRGARCCVRPSKKKNSAVCVCVSTCVSTGFVQVALFQVSCSPVKVVPHKEQKESGMRAP